MAVQPGWCRTWSETPKTGFLTTRLILFLVRVSVCNLFSQFDNSSITKFQVLENNKKKNNNTEKYQYKSDPLLCTLHKDGGYLGLDKSDNFQYFSIKSFVVGMFLKCLTKAILIAS